MIRLFAIPFDKYTSRKTEEGMIFNIVDKDNNVYAQCCVAHRKYTLHDLLIEDISGAPSNTKLMLSQLLNKILGVGKYKIVSVLSRKMVRDNKRFNDPKFDDRARKIAFDIESKRLILSQPQISSQKGLY